MDTTDTCIGCEIVSIENFMRTAIWESGTQGFVIGISGGIDSAVACALAVKAVGNERVLGVFMPASIQGMKEYADAKSLSDFLGVSLITVSLQSVLSEFMKTEYITNTPILTGNIAARLRMTTLYNIAAARQYLVCGTSNKTEYLIGYSTKWGDGAADVQPLLHLYKKDVYAIAHELNLPDAIIRKSPSAGFFEGQTDEDELGMKYSELDDALSHLEANNFIPQTDFEEKVMNLVKKSMHKRNLPRSKIQ